MPRNIEAHPSTVIADVPAIPTGDCNLPSEWLDPVVFFAEARQRYEASRYRKCAKSVPTASSICCHLLTADDAETLQKLGAGLGKPDVCPLMQAAGAATSR